MLVLVLGGLRVIEGHLSLGMLVAFQSLMQSFLAPVTTLVGFASTLQDLQGALHRLDDVLHNPALPARVQTPCPAPYSTAGWHGSVQVRNLTFGYSRVTMRPAAPSENPATLREPLEAIARASHLRLRRVRLSDNWWQHDCGPLLAYTQEDHRPVALLPVAATRYVLFDPLHHTRTPVQALLAVTLVPQAYTFYRPFPQRALRWCDLLAFGLRGCGKDLLLVLLSGLAVTLLGMLAPHATAIMIDTAIPDADRRMVLQLGVALLAAACGQTLLQLAQGWALLRQHTTAGAALQAALWDRLLTLPPPFFASMLPGTCKHASWRSVPCSNTSVVRRCAPCAPAVWRCSTWDCCSSIVPPWPWWRLPWPWWPVWPR